MTRLEAWRRRRASARSPPAPISRRWSRVDRPRPGDGDIVRAHQQGGQQGRGAGARGRPRGRDPRARRSGWWRGGGRRRSSRTRLGLVMAAAGVDASNVAAGHVVLLPEDPDASARTLRARVYADDRPQRRRRRHRHRRTGLAHRPDRPRDRRRRARAARDLAGRDRPLRQPAGRHRAGGRRRARRRWPSWSPASSAAARCRWCADSRTSSSRRTSTAPGRGALVRARATRTCSPSAPARPSSPQWPARDADCFGSPATADEVLAALRECGLEGVPAAARSGWRSPQAAYATRWRPWNAPGSSRTPTAGDHTATRRPETRHRRTPSPSHRPVRRLPTHDTPDEGGQVAKKNARDNERRAIAEQMRKDQERKERRRSLLILGGCVLVVVGLLTAALIPYLQQRSEAKKLEETPLSDLGATNSAAECEPGHEEERHGQRRAHQPAGEDPLHQTPARLRPALGQLPPGLGDPQLLLHRGPSRGRAPRAQPRARPHDPLVRRHREAGSRPTRTSRPSPTSSTPTTDVHVGPVDGAPTAARSPTASTSR